MHDNRKANESRFIPADTIRIRGGESTIPGRSVTHVALKV